MKNLVSSPLVGKSTCLRTCPTSKNIFLSDNFSPKMQFSQKSNAQKENLSVIKNIFC